MAYLDPKATAFNLNEAHRRDHNSGDTITLRLDFEPDGKPIGDSLAYIKEAVGALMTDNATLEVTKNLYILGNFVSSRTETNLTPEEQVTQKVKEWDVAIEVICGLIRKLAPEAVIWVSGLPFKPVVWDALSPKVIRKLILDVGQPVYFDLYDYNPVYISCEEMKPLTKFTLLEELRILHIYKGVQPIVWKTVYGNKVGMQILELQMAEPPLTEREINWTQADKVMGLKVSQDNVHKYKGHHHLANGGLFYTHGMGEYLDSLCIRKARNACLFDTKKPIPLVRLVLDGFVVDELPFEDELKALSLLVCGKQCVDAGLRPPTVHFPSTTKNLPPQDSNPSWTVVFPKWMGVFDSEGNMLHSQNFADEPSLGGTSKDETDPGDGKRKQVEESSQAPKAAGALQHLDVSEALKTSDETLPLTTDSLSKLNLEDASKVSSAQAEPSHPDIGHSTSKGLDEASIVSTRGGSEAPTGDTGMLFAGTMKRAPSSPSSESSSIVIIKRSDSELTCTDNL